MRPLAWSVAAPLLTLALGCAGGSDPIVAEGPGASSAGVGLGPVAVQGDLNYAPLGVYRVHLNPDASTASVEMLATRSGQATDDLYEFSIGNFMKADTLQIAGFSVEQQTVDLHYRVKHPYGAPPNPGGTPTASNRADLSIAARVLFLADVPSAIGNTFFTNKVANTALVMNADGYIEPKAALSLGGFAANTFPFRTLVDEGLDQVTESSTGNPLPNLGPEGNYADLVGWQFATLTPGWRGYGVLHQGQTVTNKVTLRRSALGAGPSALDLVIFAKYNDPRGGTSSQQKRNNRLPKAAADVTKFVYRMPHGALDLEKIDYVGESGGFAVNTASSSELRFRIRDWDARAVETTLTDLATDPDAAKVAIGESGIPGLEICIPGVLGNETTIQPVLDPPFDDDSGFGGDASVDSGIPGDELFYRLVINKAASTGQTGGTFVGMLRALDPEAATDRHLKWWFPLDPQLIPLTTDFLDGSIYQRFAVEQHAPAGWMRKIGILGNEQALSVSLHGSNAVVAGNFSRDVDFGGGMRTAVGSFDGFVAKYTASGAHIWDYTMGGVGVDQVGGVATDLAGNVYVCGQINSATVDLGGGVRTIVSAPDAFIVKLSSDGLYQWDQVFGNAAGAEVANDVAVDVAAMPWIGGYFTSDALTAFGATPLDSLGEAGFLAQLDDVTGLPVTSRKIDGAVVGTESVRALEITPGTQDPLAFLEYGTANIDFGGGPRILRGTKDVAVVRYGTSSLTWTWDQAFGSNGADAANGIAVNPTIVAVTGSFVTGGSINFGGGPITPSVRGTDIYAALYSHAAGTFNSYLIYGSAGTDVGRGIALDASNNVVLSGQYSTGLNFGGGSRTSVGGFDAFVVKNLGGGYVWDAVWGGSGTENAFGVAVDALSHVTVVGSFATTVDFDPGAPVFNQTSGGSNDAFVMKLLGNNGRWQ